jgi:hypothetical protein
MKKLQELYYDLIRVPPMKDGKRWTDSRIGMAFWKGFDAPNTWRVKGDRSISATAYRAGFRYRKVFVNKLDRRKR